MLSLFSKGESSGPQDKESNFISSFLGLPSAPSSAKKASGGARDKAENYLDVTKEIKELKAVSVSRPLDKKKDNQSKDRNSNKDSKDWNRSSQSNRSENYDKAKEYKRDDDRKGRDSSNDYNRDKPKINGRESTSNLKVNRDSSNDFTIKRKSNPDNGGNSSPKIKKVDSSSFKKPQASSMSSSRPDSKCTSQQNSSRPQSSNNSRVTPVTAQAKGRSFNGSLERLPKSVPLGQSLNSGSRSGSASGSKPGSSSIKPSSGSNSSSKPIQVNRSLSGKPMPSNSSQPRPSSGNTMSRPVNGKPGSSNMTSRPGSQQPLKRPMNNGVSSRPQNGGTMTKSRPIPVTPPVKAQAPAVRYVNGKPVPLKPGESQGRMDPPPSRGPQSNLAKRPGDHLPNSRYEPATGKKPITTFSSVFKGGPSRKPHRGYDDSEDDDYDDDFIDDGDPNEEADQELKRMFGKYRQRVEKTRHLVDDASDMEAGFDVIEREEEMSKLIGDEEDRRQLEFIKREAEEEMARERKRKRLQID